MGVPHHRWKPRMFRICFIRLGEHTQQETYPPPPNSSPLRSLPLADHPAVSRQPKIQNVTNACKYNVYTELKIVSGGLTCNHSFHYRSVYFFIIYIKSKALPFGQRSYLHYSQRSEEENKSTYNSMRLTIEITQIN